MIEFVNYFVAPAANVESNKNPQWQNQIKWKVQQQNQHGKAKQNKALAMVYGKLNTIIDIADTREKNRSSEM